MESDKLSFVVLFCKVELYHTSELLQGHYTMRDLAYIYSWQKVGCDACVSKNTINTLTWQI